MTDKPGTGPEGTDELGDDARKPGHYTPKTRGTQSGYRYLEKSLRRSENGSRVFRGASHAQLTELGEEQLSLSRKLTASLEAELQE
jgi:hypothetical protein